MTLMGLDLSTTAASNFVNGVDLTRHLGLVGMTARRFRWAVGGVFEEGDLFQAGVFGLRRAAEKFQSDRGCTFATYAVWWIAQSIRRTIADQRRTVRVPVHAQEDAWKRGEPFALDALSLDAPLSPQDPRSETGLDRLSVEDDAATRIEAKDRTRLVEQALSRLPERTRQIIRDRFWCDVTLQEIGASLGVSRERIRQVEAEALAQLRRHLEGAR